MIGEGVNFVKNNVLGLKDDLSKLIVELVLRRDEPNHVSIVTWAYDGIVSIDQERLGMIDEHLRLFNNNYESAKDHYDLHREVNKLCTSLRDFELDNPAVIASDFLIHMRLVYYLTNYAHRSTMTFQHVYALMESLLDVVSSQVNIPTQKSRL